MTFLDVQTPQRKTFPALSAGLSLFLASAFSIAGMNLFGRPVHRLGKRGYFGSVGFGFRVGLGLSKT